MSLAAVSPVNDLSGSKAIEKLTSLLDKLDKEGLKAYIILSEIQKEQTLLEESRKIGSKS